jgi:hypothetical protein
MLGGAQRAAADLGLLRGRYLRNRSFHRELLYGSSARSHDVGFFSLIVASLLAAALLVSLLVGEEISGPKVAFIARHP